MRIVFTSDLHGNTGLYAELFELATRIRAEAIILGGDLLPLNGPFYQTIGEQELFIYSFLKPELSRFMSRNNRSIVYALTGNTDWRANRIALTNLADEGLLKLLHGAIHPLGNGYQLVGYGHVPPTPFVIKDGERRDRQSDGIPVQRSTPCCSKGGKIIVVDRGEHFGGKRSIEEDLRQLPRPADYQKTVYVMHSPPYGTGLDVLSTGGRVGSRAIRDFITVHQPHLTLHGHVHEAPEISSGYLDRIGGTVCVNPGQSMAELYAVSFELEDIAASMEHTVLENK